MATIVLIIVFALLGLDALIARGRIALRGRAAASPTKPAWDLSSPSRGGWRPLESGATQPDDSSQEPADDLSRLFDQGRFQAPRPNLGASRPEFPARLLGGRRG